MRHRAINRWFSGFGRCDNLLVRKAGITVDLVSRLIQTQFPQWAGLPVRPVETDGWDNATFRLSGQASRVFKHRLPVDPATWTRGRGWAI